ncbi:MAG: LysR family transcriptional regulator [Gammaproteobacteria bacterium]|nr:MAG: LysR family transcriptional regulator [Gammaproteobacteria bacterium]
MASLFDINLNRLVVFVAVVETGSITGAAKRLGLAKTMVSTHIQKLEVEIGSNLLVRTTRRLHLTEAGTQFYQACQKILQDTEAAIAMASSNTQQVRGKLRVSASVDFGASVVAPLAAKLTKMHPELRIEIISSDHRVDMVAEGIDVAIRIGRLADSSHKATLIAQFEEWVVATPEFFSDRLPQRPKDLEQYPFVALSVLPNLLNWNFVRDENVSESVRFNASIISNTSIAVKAAVLVNAGFMIQPDFLVAEEIAAGKLIRVVPEWNLSSGGIYAVFPASVQRSHKVSVFISALKKLYTEK